MQKPSVLAQTLWAKKSKTGNMQWLPLSIHITDTFGIAKKLWNNWLSDGVKLNIAEGLSSPKQAEQLYLFLAAAHDIGKATPVFQAKQSVYPASDLDESIYTRSKAAGLPLKPYSDFTAPQKTPHAIASYHLFIKHGFNSDIALVVGAHHGKPPDTSSAVSAYYDGYEENYNLGMQYKDAWESVQTELFSYALALSRFTSDKEMPSVNMAAQVLLSSLIVMADWLASNEVYFPYIQFNDCLDPNALERRVHSAWHNIDFKNSWPPDFRTDYDDIYQERFNYIANPMQKAVLELAASTQTPGIVILEAPMGMGKTEAALVGAEIFSQKAQRRGIFFALPTQATSNAVFSRLLVWVKMLDTHGSHSVNLAHGKAQFNHDFRVCFEGRGNIGETEEDNISIHQWFNGSKKSLLADFVTGTIDQLLFAALKQKHVMLRHLGLSNKVVVIDECHAYDAYMNHFLYTALRWLGEYQVPVIILSATLPLQRRRMLIEAYKGLPAVYERQVDELSGETSQPAKIPDWVTNISYPVITYTDDDKEVRQKIVITDPAIQNVAIIPLSDECLCDTLCKMLSGGGCAGIIVNTVKRAQNEATRLRAIFGDDAITLLHSRYVAPQRASREEFLLQMMGKPSDNPYRPTLHIVIGTQVLEQSLDIDFDLMVSELCPIDLLIQRIGRLHRHSRKRPTLLNQARCYVLGTEGEMLDRGSIAVYGEYLLLRTRYFLPLSITLPHDISKLVQSVYDDAPLPEPLPKRYKEAVRKHRLMIEDQQARAETFRICEPTASNMLNWLNTSVGSNEKQGEAAVRDGDESIEVLLIRHENDGNFRFVTPEDDTWQLSPDDVPDSETAIRLACQSIRLPHVLCTSWRIRQTIEELECSNRLLEKWQQSPWLRGELFLILDTELTTTLCEYRLNYNLQNGLMYHKEAMPDE